MSLDLALINKFAVRASDLASAQAAKFCPNRRLELESMAPRLANMLSEVVDELRMVANGIDSNRQLPISMMHSYLDVRILEIVEKNQPIMSRGIMKIHGRVVDEANVQDRLLHLNGRGHVSYESCGPDRGWSIRE